MLLKRVHVDLSTREILAEPLQNISLFTMPASGCRCERKRISEVLESGNRVTAYPPTVQNGRCPRSQPCLMEGTWHWSSPLCSAGPGGLHVFGPTAGQEEVVPLLLWPCLCFNMSLLAEDWSSSSFFPSASPHHFLPPVTHCTRFLRI